MAADDDTPYERVRERILGDAAAPQLGEERSGDVTVARPPVVPGSLAPRELTEEERRAAAEFVRSVKAARERCDAGHCTNRDCDLGRKCPFKRFKRGQQQR